MTCGFDRLYAPTLAWGFLVGVLWGWFDRSPRHNSPPRMQLTLPPSTRPAHRDLANSLEWSVLGGHNAPIGPRHHRQLGDVES